MDLPALSDIMSALLVLVLPGAAGLAFLRRYDDPLEWLADAVGLSISLSALVFLGAFLFHFRLTAEGITFLYGLAGVIWISGAVFRWVRDTRTALWEDVQDQSPAALRKSWVQRLIILLVGLSVLAGITAWRLWQARSLVLPAWVDSVHHVLLVQKILALGAVPADLSPEISAPFSYHFGFHVLGALYAFWSNLEPARAVLVFGQVLNAFVSLAAYRLAKAAWGDARRAALAGLLVGFAFQMPAYYVTWGRYTLLSGLLILVPAVANGIEASRAVPVLRQGRGVLAVVMLLTAGLALTHYTALWLFALFLFLWGVIRLTADLLRGEQTLAARLKGSPVFPLAAAVLVGLLLASPWMLRLLSDLSAHADLSVVDPRSSDQSGYWNYILYLLGPKHNNILLIAAGAGLLLNLVRGRARWLAVWGLLLVLLTLPWGLRFGPFRPDHYAILLFLPGAPLLADLLVSAADAAGWLAVRIAHREWAGAVLSAALVVFGGAALLVWGGRETRNVINTVTVLADEADLAALDWIRQHVPEQARFFVNTTVWQYNTYRGVDGGYWMLTYTGRESIMPPALYDLGEPEYKQQVNSVVQRASQLNTCNEDFWALAADAGLTHVYIREGKGALQPGELNSCSGLIPIYRKSGVYLYEIEQR